MTQSRRLSMALEPLGNSGVAVSNLTVLNPKAFESDQELAMTLVHEAFSHQILNLLDSQEDEARAEQEASLCGIEN